MESWHPFQGSVFAVAREKELAENFFVQVTLKYKLQRGEDLIFW